MAELQAQVAHFHFYTCKHKSQYRSSYTFHNLAADLGNVNFRHVGEKQNTFVETERQKLFSELLQDGDADEKRERRVA